MRLNGIAIEAVEVARMKAAASLTKTASFSSPRRRISHEERQAQIRTLIELEELLNLENLATTGMTQRRSSSRSMRRHNNNNNGGGGSSSSSVRKPSSSYQDWESRSVNSAPNMASSYHRPRVVDISRAATATTSPFDDNESTAGFSFHSESKVSSRRRSSGYDDDDMSSVGLRSVNSDSKRNSKHRRSTLKALFGSRKKKSSSGTSTTSKSAASGSEFDTDDRSTTTSKSRKLFLFSRRNSTETTDATSVVSDGSLQTRRRRGLFGLGAGGRGRSTDAASATGGGGDDSKSVHSYNSAAGSVASMMRRLKRGQAAAAASSKRLNDDDDDEERSLDSVSAISTNTQSSEKSKNKFNIFKFLSRQKKAKKAIQNFEELPTFLIPDRVAIPEPESPLPTSWQDKKLAATASPVVVSPVESLAPSVTYPRPRQQQQQQPVPLVAKRDLYVRGADGSVEVQVQMDAMMATAAATAPRPPLPDKRKKKTRSSSMSSTNSSSSLSSSIKQTLPSKESREILFDCHEETKTIDGEDDDGSVFTILSGIIAAWASETAAKKARDPTAPRSMSFIETGVKSCFKAENPVKPRYSVTFGVISIREYERTVGDNPSVTSGPPISIGWSYMPSFEAAVDEYETSRPCRRTKREFYLPSDLRKDLLLNEWGYSVEEVRRAKREATYIQYHREKSAYQGLLSEKAQELAESTRRKVNRLRNGNNTKKEQEKLWDQAQERLGVLSKPPPTTLLVNPADGMDEEM